MLHLDYGFTITHDPGDDEAMKAAFQAEFPNTAQVVLRHPFSASWLAVAKTRVFPNTR